MTYSEAENKRALHSLVGAFPNVNPQRFRDVLKERGAIAILNGVDPARAVLHVIVDDVIAAEMFPPPPDERLQFVVAVFDRHVGVRK